MSPSPLLPEIHFDETVCRDFEAASRREWLETNGIGGFACSTIPGMNTRRYHSLLTASMRPPVERLATLSKLDEILEINGRAFELATNRYPGAVHPRGYLLLKEFHVDPFPRWVFEAGGARLEKCLFMVYGQNAIVVTYTLTNADGKRFRGDARLRVRPFVAMRDYHSLGRENPWANAWRREEENLFALHVYDGAPALLTHHNGWEYSHSPDWYRDFEYGIERERGLDYLEDLYTPGELSFDPAAERGLLLISVEPSTREAEGGKRNLNPARVADMLRDKEIRRREALLKGFDKSDDATRRLVLAADRFVVRRSGQSFTILAGYPWFTDWGRDTMICLPGIAIAPRRYDIAKEILSTFVAYAHRGLIPNVFPDGPGEPAYNTIDATLWFFVAASLYIDATNDVSFLANTLWGLFEEVIHYHKRGSLFNIRMDSDGLLAGGSAETQLTWMDAKIGDYVVTPRHGKAVEINALWYNALRVMERFAGLVSANPAPYASMAETTLKSFNKKFWNAAAGCLFDVVDGARVDAAIRPNQVFALSLPSPLLSAERAESVLNVVTEKLLTPYGLRTLAPDDAAYRSRCDGGVFERDTAYHQGTVWPWLIGPYVSAFLNVRGRNATTIAEARALLKPLEAHLFDYGLDSVSEIFDGDPPHAPRGCFAQAWSVSETLRVKLEMDAMKF